MTINNRRKFLKAATLGAAATTVLTPTLSQAADKKKTRLRMQTLWGKENRHIFDTFADNIKVASEKSLRLKIHQGSEIVPDAEMLNAVSKGTLDMCEGYGGYWPGQIDVGLIEGGIAGAWTSYDEATYLFNNGLGDLIQAAYHEQNVHYLGSVMGGPYDLLTKTPVKSIEDLKGMKIRATPSVAKILQQFEIPTVFMPASELYVGLSTGAIDGVIYGGPIEYVSMKLYEVAKYYTNLNLISPGFTECILINLDKWKGLTPANQKILELAVADHTTSLHAWLMEGTFKNEYRKHFEFGNLPANDSKQLRQAATVLWDEEAAKSERNKQAIQLFKDMAARR